MRNQTSSFDGTFSAVGPFGLDRDQDSRVLLPSTGPMLILGT